MVIVVFLKVIFEVYGKGVTFFFCFFLWLFFFGSFFSAAVFPWLFFSGYFFSFFLWLFFSGYFSLVLFPWFFFSGYFSLVTWLSTFFRFLLFCFPFRLQTPISRREANRTDTRINPFLWS